MQLLHERPSRHGAALHGAQSQLVDLTLGGTDLAPLSEKTHALLAIAGKVRQGGYLVTVQNMARARAAGAEDGAVRDIVLIAATIWMFICCADGLATPVPTDPAAFRRPGQRFATEGQLDSIRRLALAFWGMRDTSNQEHPCDLNVSPLSLGDSPQMDSHRAH